MCGCSKSPVSVGKPGLDYATLLVVDLAATRGVAAKPLHDAHVATYMHVYKKF